MTKPKKENPNASAYSEELSAALLARLRQQETTMHTELNKIGTKAFEKQEAFTSPVLNERAYEFDHLGLTIGQYEFRMMD